MPGSYSHRPSGCRRCTLISLLVVATLCRFVGAASLSCNNDGDASSTGEASSDEEMGTVSFDGMAFATSFMQAARCSFLITAPGRISLHSLLVDCDPGVHQRLEAENSHSRGLC